MHQVGRPIAIAGLACVTYLVLARVAFIWGGDLLPIPLWFATASTVCFALVLPVKDRWPTISGGAVAGNLISGFWLFDETARSLAVPGISVFLETVFAVLALDHFLGHGESIDRTRRSLKVLGITVAAGCLGATIAAIDTASPVIDDRGSAWVRWALGDVVGLVILVPLVLAYRVPVITPRHSMVPAEAIAAFITVIVSAFISFNVDFQLVYLVVPGILWLAIRFGPRLASPAALVAVVLGTYYSGAGSGPFSTSGSNPVVQVQGFALAVGICALVAGSHAVRAWDDHQQLAAILRALPDVVAVRNSAGELINSWIPARLGDAAASLVEPSTRSDNPLTTIEPGGLEPTRITTATGFVFERRTAIVDEERSLHLFRDITERDRLDRAFRAQKDNLTLAIINEQIRIGRLLHDGPVQELSSATLLIGLAKQGAPEPQVQNLERAEKLTAEAIGDLRTMSDLLIPPSARSGEVVQALAHYGREAFRDREIVLDVEDSMSSPISGDQAETLYLVGREALTNVAFHSEASAVRITLAGQDDHAVLEISDNGKGLPHQFDDSRRHFGVQLMFERVEEQGGSFVIASPDSGGVSVQATIPTS